MGFLRIVSHKELWKHILKSFTALKVFKKGLWRSFFRPTVASKLEYDLETIVGETFIKSSEVPKSPPRRPMTIIQPPDFSPIETRQTRSGSLNISHVSLNKSSAKTPRKSSKSPNEGSKLSTKPLNSSLSLDKPTSPQIGTVISNKSLVKTPRKASKSPAKSKIVPPTVM